MADQTQLLLARQASAVVRPAQALAVTQTDAGAMPAMPTPLVVQLHIPAWASQSVSVP
jgi:hypothetical protein